MRAAFLTRIAPLALLAALCLPGSAQAQFTNHSIGFEAGFFYLTPEVGATSGPTLGINSTLYLDHGVDLYFRAQAGLHQEGGGMPNPKNLIGVFPALGLRYLFSQEDFRPFVGGCISYLHFFGSDSGLFPDALFAVVPIFGGAEYYVASNTAIGFQVEYHRTLVLNETLLVHNANAIAASAKVAWGF